MRVCFLPLKRSTGCLFLNRVQPFTRLGIGGALLAEAEAEAIAAASGDACIWLTPWAENRRALRFYAKHAYVDLGRTDFVMEGERFENRVLAKSLPA